MKRSSPHASGVFGLWRRLGLGFVGMTPLPVTSAVPLSLSEVRRGTPGSSSGLCPLWAFPAATRMEPGSACRMGSKCPRADAVLRLGPMLPLLQSRPHRKLVCILVSGAAVRGEWHEDDGAGIKFFTQRFHLHPRHPRALLPSRIALRAFAPQIAPPERFAYGRHSLPGSSPRMMMGVE